MFDIGWTELLLISAVALVAVGPKDLPKVMYALGQWARKARRAVLAVQHDFDRLGAEAERLEREEREEKHDHDS